MINKFYFTLFALLFCLLQMRGQDAQFTQFYNAPVYLNPALTGLMNRDLRLHTNYRTQWGTAATPFRTMAISADMSTLKPILDDDIMGIGIMVVNDRAGEVGLQTTELSMSLAFSKSLNNEGNHFISFGGQAGMVQQRIDVEKLIFDNQIDGTVINQNLPSNEGRIDGDINYYDVGAGLGWSYSPDRFTSFYAGVAVDHLSQPNVSFTGDGSGLLQLKKTFYAGSEFRLNHMLSLLPRGVYLAQGPYRQLTFGALMKANLSQSNGYNYKDVTSIYFGTMHRINDAQMMLLRFDYANFGLSFSYDVNISKFQRGTNGHGAVELALMYRTSFLKPTRNTNSVICPRF